jgi:hypothetical protein
VFTPLCCDFAWELVLFLFIFIASCSFSSGPAETTPARTFFALVLRPALQQSAFIAHCTIYFVINAFSARWSSARTHALFYDSLRQIVIKLLPLRGRMRAWRARALMTNTFIVSTPAERIEFNLSHNAAFIIIDGSSSIHPPLIGCLIIIYIRCIACIFYNSEHTSWEMFALLYRVGVCDLISLRRLRSREV